MFEQKFSFVPKMYIYLTKRLALNPKCLNKSLASHSNFLNKSFSLHPKCLNKNLCKGLNKVFQVLLHTKFCFEQKYSFVSKTFKQKSYFALNMFEQKSCLAAKMFEQKSCFTPKMFEQQSSLCIRNV